MTYFAFLFYKQLNQTNDKKLNSTALYCLYGQKLSQMKQTLPSKVSMDTLVVKISLLLHLNMESRV